MASIYLQIVWEVIFLKIWSGKTLSKEVGGSPAVAANWLVKGHKLGTTARACMGIGRWVRMGKLTAIISMV